MALEFEGLTAADLEALDPHPDVHALFNYYNQLYFNDCLGACSVEWSTKRMTLCAGVCHFQRGGGCRIKLSAPLLKYRPVKDLKETLLHEMIHAELFLKGVRDDGDHGPKFRARMEAINKATFLDTQRPVEGYNITVYHTMHDEVNLYRTHVWRCNRCHNTVKRSMNRPPQEADCRAYNKAVAAAAVAGGMPGSYCKDQRCWYHSHVKLCGGQYIKIQEPDKPQSPASGKAASSSTSGSSKRLKHPAAAAAAAAGASGSRSIEAFFKPDRQNTQQQHQHQQPSLRGSVPDGEQQQQLQQQQSSQGYWQTVGKGRLLGAFSQGRSSEVAGVAVAAVESVSILAKQQQQDRSLSQSPSSQARQSLKSPQQQQQAVKQGSQPLSQLPALPHKQQQWQQNQQQQQQRCRKQRPTALDVVELLSSEDENVAADDEDVAEAAASASAAAAWGASPAAVGRATVCAMSCPVCCQEWLPGEISNEQLNIHLDECLARMHC